MQYLGFDIHKKYTFYTQMDAVGQIQRQGKLTCRRPSASPSPGSRWKAALMGAGVFMMLLGGTVGVSTLAVRRPVAGQDIAPGGRGAERT